MAGVKVPPLIALLPCRMTRRRLRGILPVLRRRYVTMRSMGAHRLGRPAVYPFFFSGGGRRFIEKGSGCLTGPPTNLFQYRPYRAIPPRHPPRNVYIERSGRPGGEPVAAPVAPGREAAIPRNVAHLINP